MLWTKSVHKRKKDKDGRRKDQDRKLRSSEARKLGSSKLGPQTIEANARIWKLRDFRCMDFKHKVADQKPDAKVITADKLEEQR